MDRKQLKNKIKRFLKGLNFMALSELYDRAISRACRSVRTVIPFQDADITDAQIWPQLKACLLGSVLKTDSIYTQMPV